MFGGCKRSYMMDETGKIHYTKLHHTADNADPVIPEPT
jgi:hypothetical protein